MIVPTYSPSVNASPVVQQVAGRQYGRWAAQFRYANVASAAARDVELRRRKDALDALQKMHDSGSLTDDEFTRLANQV